VPDTIVAAATPAGYGGIAVVRLSGAAVPVIAAQLLGALPAPRLAPPPRRRPTSSSCATPPRGGRSGRR